MRKTVLTVLGATLIAASATQFAAAAERHHVDKVERPAASQFHNANNSVAAPVQSGWTYSGFSAPAGR